MATFDTVAAYLNQIYPDDLKPINFRFPKKLALACGLDPNAQYRVKTYMYGLPDAGRAYYLAYSSYLTNNGYIQSKYDPCLFTKFNDSIKSRTNTWMHVEDTFISYTHPEEVERFQKILSEKYKITADYNVLSRLGINLIHNEDGSIKLTQPKLLE